MNAVGKEIAKKILRTIKSFNVDIGPKKNPTFARKQEAKVMRVLAEKFPEYIFRGIAEWYAAHYNGAEIPTKIETKYGDILVYDKETKKCVCIIELKVGTKPEEPNSVYFGAPTLFSVNNKVKQEEKDGFPRLIICVNQRNEYRICDPDLMIEKAKKLNVWIKSSVEKENNPIFKEFDGKVKVGKTKDTASTKNTLHVKDFFPSYLIDRHIFDVV